jgi:hypothetical protein
MYASSCSSMSTSGRPGGGLLPQRRPAAKAAEGLIEHPAQPVGYLIEFLERLPPLGNTRPSTLGK